MFWASSCPSSGATTAAAASGLPLELGDSSAVGSGQAGQPDHDQQHCYHQAPTVNQRLLLQLLLLLMMGMRMPETCWVVFKWQVINLRSCCILLVDSVETTWRRWPWRQRHCEPLKCCKLLILRHTAVSQKTWILNNSYFGIRAVTEQTYNVNVTLYWQRSLRGYWYRSDKELAHRTLKVQSHIICAWFHISPGAHVCFIGLPLTQM